MINWLTRLVRALRKPKTLDLIQVIAEVKAIVPFDPWCMTFAWVWYMGTEHEDRIHSINEGRVTRGVPSIFE